MIYSMLGLMSSISLQSVDVAKELLYTKEVTVIGVLLFLVSILLSVVVYLYKKHENVMEDRLEEHKEFTKDIISITKETGDTVRQVNAILKITQHV